MINKSKIRLGDKLYSLDQGLVMGIANCTPDSFYAESRLNSPVKVENRINRMVDEGVDIIDLGAQSSRPGAKIIDQDEEWLRLEPVLKFIRKKHPDIPFSVDTFRSEIARRAVLDYGIQMINDISAGIFDEKMPEMAGELQVPVVLMHMNGTPETMQDDPEYENVSQEVLQFMASRIAVFRDRGVHDLIIDPGFGFGKTLSQNFQLLNELEKFVALGLPILVGFSRKSMIYNSLSVSADEALNGTTVINSLARMKGASVFRVHDVKEAKECLRLVNQTVNPNLINEG